MTNYLILTVYLTISRLSRNHPKDPGEQLRVLIVIHIEIGKHRIATVLVSEITREILVSDPLIIKPFSVVNFLYLFLACINTYNVLSCKLVIFACLLYTKPSSSIGTWTVDCAHTYVSTSGCIANKLNSKGASTPRLTATHDKSSSVYKHSC
jgi:hypothetical protein